MLKFLRFALDLLDPSVSFAKMKQHVYLCFFRLQWFARFELGIYFVSFYIYCRDGLLSNFLAEEAA